MKTFYHKLITASLLIGLFILLCGVGPCDSGYTISGTVDGDVQSGVAISLAHDGGGIITTTTKADGRYTYVFNPGTYTVTPSLIGYTFIPASRSVIIIDADETGVDFIATEEERFTDNGDGTVYDERTGLLWLKNANCYAEQDWDPAMLSAAGLNSGECGLTDGSVEGDWRLPTRAELMQFNEEDWPATWYQDAPFDFDVGEHMLWYWSGTECHWGSQEEWDGALCYNVYYSDWTTCRVKYSTSEGKPKAWPVRSGN